MAPDYPVSPPSMESPIPARQAGPSRGKTCRRPGWGPQCTVVARRTGMPGRETGRGRRGGSVREGTCTSMSDGPGPIVVHAGDGPTIGLVGDTYRFLAVGGQTSGRYAIWETIVPPGGGPPPHIQSREDEGFYVLEGEVAFYAE